jgi:hypothetical protein
VASVEILISTGVARPQEVALRGKVPYIVTLDVQTGRWHASQNCNISCEARRRKIASPCSHLLNMPHIQTGLADFGGGDAGEANGDGGSLFDRRYHFDRPVVRLGDFS